MKVINIITKVIFILAMPVFLFTLVVAIGVNCPWLYNHGMAKYNVSEVTGIAPSELQKVTGRLISYFNSNEEYINVVVQKDGEPFTVFNEKEAVHLKDVKELFWLDYKACLGSLIYLATYAGVIVSLKKKAGRRRVAAEISLGGLVTLCIMGLLGVGILTGFDQLFWNFHLMSFSNDFWLLNPETDYLVMLFPQGFWYDAFLMGAVATAFLALVAFASGGVYWMKKRKEIYS